MNIYIFFNFIREMTKTKILFLCTGNIDRSSCAESLFKESEI